MLENHYYDEMLRYVTDLINDPPEFPTELVRRWEAEGLGPATADEQDLHDVRAFLLRWAEVVDAQEQSHRVALLNALLAESVAYPRITDHAGTGWHLHYRDDDVRLATVIRAVAAVAGAEHLTRHGMHRFGRCALSDCARAFVDFSRPGRQRYCSRVCANRDAVRRHRSRKGAGGAPAYC